MDYIFTYPREEFEKENGLNEEMITRLIGKHQSMVAEVLKRNKAYYDGEHAIKTNERKKKDAPNQKTVCNHAKDISDTASGYFMGSPIAYGAADGTDITALTDAFALAEVDDVDQDNALLISIYGKAYDYTYAAEDEAELKVKGLSPENTFIVYDDTIEQRELFGVYYYVKKDDANDKSCYVATICTDAHIYNFLLYPGHIDDNKMTGEPEEHNLGSVPITEYKNNKFDIGDFEQQIGLIDAYNTLMADRVNDKEQFIDALLILYGAILADESVNKKENETSDDEDMYSEARLKLRKAGILELPEDAKAEYLTRALDENGVETLRKALKEDIYTFSHVPNLTDEKFAGNSSGVAMEYKLLGLEMLTKIKERYYKKGVRKRIKMFCHFLGLKNKSVDPAKVVPTFSRSLPQNLVELANMIATLSDKVSAKTLIKLLPFVENPDEEIEAVKAEKSEAVERQREMFKQTVNIKPEEEIDEDE